MSIQHEALTDYAAKEAKLVIPMFVAAVSIGGLSALFSTCAPAVGPVTLAAVASYESGTRPWAIGDNTAHRSYLLDSREKAEMVAGDLLARGHNVDLGLMQINSVHLGQNGLHLSNVFDPCTNVTEGAAILRGAYHIAERRFGPGQNALMHALSAYNTGSLYAGGGYANAVRERARALSTLTSSFVGSAPIPIRTHPVRIASGLSPTAVAGHIGDGERTGAPK